MNKHSGFPEIHIVSGAEIEELQVHFACKHFRMSERREISEQVSGTLSRGKRCCFSQDPQNTCIIIVFSLRRCPFTSRQSRAMRRDSEFIDNPRRCFRVK